MSKADRPFQKNVRRLTCLPLFILLLVFSATVMSLPGCSTRPAGEEVTINICECAGKFKETIAFQDTLTAISEEMITAIYRITAADVVQQQVFVSTGATAEEIAVFEAVDDKAAQRIELAVRERLTDQITSFKDYLPTELPKLEDPFIAIKGKYVILCVSDHNEDAKTVLNTFLK